MFEGLIGNQDSNQVAVNSALPDLMTPDVDPNIPDGMREQAFYAPLTDFIAKKWFRATEGRRATEIKWLEAWHATRGEYYGDDRKRLDDALSRNPQASQMFVKITKAKVMGIYGQIMEVLFANNTFPLGVEPLNKPIGISESVYITQEGQPGSLDDASQQDPNAQGSDTDSDQDPSQSTPLGYDGDGNDPEPGTTAADLFTGYFKKFTALLSGKKVNEGPSPDKSKAMQFNPADMASEQMNKVIQDQCNDGELDVELGRTVLECVQLGTGVFKGPFTKTETIPNWEYDTQKKINTYKPILKDIPQGKFVSCWNFYPDPDATSIRNAGFAIERHLMTETELKALAKRPQFDKSAIQRVIRNTPGYSKQMWEEQIRDNRQNVLMTRYEVLEYWGYVDADIAIMIGLIEEKDAIGLDILQVNVWQSGGEILRCILNPFEPQVIPYQVVPYEEHLYQIWGIGVAENMKDSQSLMNGHVRMAIDNLRLAGNCVFEVNEAALVAGQDLTIHPGKILRTQGALGKAINAIQFPNTAPAHLQMYQQARQLADEVTNSPSYSHGQTGVSGMTRTAGGMSMLFNAAAGSIKTVVSNIDKYLLEPFGQGLFAWNMQFNQDNPDVKGDRRVVAKGTSSLMQKEVRTQRLMTMVQVTQGNQIFQPLLNAEYVIQELAKSMDLDPQKLLNDPKTAALYAQLIGTQNGVQQGNGQQASAPNGAGTGSQPTPTGANPSDPTGTGGGTIGAATPSGPGQAGFAQGT